jgi:hypothetical protein
MSKLDHLVEVMAAEAELTEQLMDVLKVQQRALVGLDTAAVTETVDKQQELLLTIEGFENERLRLTHEMLGGNGIAGSTDDNPATLDRLLTRVAGAEAERLAAVGSRLRNAVRGTTELNRTNQHLIDHSRKFVQETFRLVTQASPRQFVDQRI